jgi:tRNA(Ile)-lysidine synthase
VLSRKAFNALLQAIINKRKFRLSAGNQLFIVYSEHCLTLEKENHREPRWQPILLSAHTQLFLPDGACLHFDIETLEHSARQLILQGKVHKNKAYLCSEKIPFTQIKVRRWQQGDCYQPLGAPGRRKLQDMFTDRKIPAHQRKTLPIICTKADEILWCPGLPPAQVFKINGSTRDAIRLTYSPR